MKLWIVLAVLTAAGAGWWAYGRDQRKKETHRRAVQALIRLDEYKDAGPLLYEPRYLDAEKSVAEDDEALAMNLKSCLSTFQTYREAADLYAKGSRLNLPDPGERFYLDMKSRVMICFQDAQVSH